MTKLFACLDGERWARCNVSANRQASLTRICSGQAVVSASLSSSNSYSNSNSYLASPLLAGGRDSASASGNGWGASKRPDAKIEGKRYQVVWSCLLLVEIIMGNVLYAAHFQTLASNVVSKVCDLLRLFKPRSTHRVLGAGAIHSLAHLRSINAKHLAVFTQCLKLVSSILPHVRAALMAQLPSKQHALLTDLDRIKR